MTNEIEVEAVVKHKIGSLWSEPNFPHKGWTIVEYVDLGQAQTICKACLIQQIRFAFTLTHPDYGTIDTIGCVCADNLATPYETEKAIKIYKKKLVAIRYSIKYAASLFNTQFCYEVNNERRKYFVYTGKDSLNLKWCYSQNGKIQVLEQNTYTDIYVLTNVIKEFEKSMQEEGY